MIEEVRAKAKQPWEDAYHQGRLGVPDEVTCPNHARDLLGKRIQLILFFISVVVHLFYYISSYSTQTLAPLFVWDAIGGLDFFQVPNGAYAFLHGGSLTGSLPYGIAPYAASFCSRVNLNVYHPLFTLLVGIPLQFLAPRTALAAWLGLHLLLMGVLVLFLWKKFRNHKYIYLALSILLLFSYHYYEISSAQYHFLFNFFTILFLCESIRNGDTHRAGLWLFLSLLVKPIGLLWLIPLVIYRQLKTSLIGFGLFALATLIFTVFPFTFGQYYLRNLFSVAIGVVQGYNIYAIKWVVPSLPLEGLKVISVLLGVGILLLQFIKKPSMLTLIILWTGYQLLFYSLVFHYHYTILAGLICLGILYDLFSPKEIGFFSVVFLTLPTPVVLFHLSVAGTPDKQLAPIYLYSVFWLCCLLIYTVFSSMRERRGLLLYKNSAITIGEIALL